MKKRYFKILSVFSLIFVLISTCNYHDEESDKPLMVELDVTINNANQIGKVPTISTGNTSIIIAVDSNTTFDSMNYELDDYDKQLLDIVNNNVSLTVPLSESIKLAEAVFTGEYTIETLYTQKPDPIQKGISEAFTVTGNETSKTISIALTNTSETETSWSGTTQFGSSAKDIGANLVIDSNENIYIVGWTEGQMGSSANAGNKDVILVKLSKTGSIEWVEQIGTTNDDTGEDIALDSADNIYIVGAWNGSSGDSYVTQDYFVAKYNSAGDQVWFTQSSESTKGDVAEAVAVYDDYEVALNLIQK